MAGLHEGTPGSEIRLVIAGCAVSARVVQGCEFVLAECEEASKLNVTSRGHCLLQGKLLFELAAPTADGSCPVA